MKYRYNFMRNTVAIEHNVGIVVSKSIMRLKHDTRKSKQNAVQT